MRALGHLNAEQFLDRKTEGVLLIHRRDIVEPVEIGHRLQVGFVLDQLLGAAVKQPDVRIHALDDFTVELEHKAQHAVRRRMLRSEIDGEIAQLGFSHQLTSSAAVFAFSATLALKRSHATTTRS